jgi:hypothetical protein
MCFQCALHIPLVTLFIQNNMTDQNYCTIASLTFTKSTRLASMGMTVWTTWIRINYWKILNVETWKVSTVWANRTLESVHSVQIFSRSVFTLYCWFASGWIQFSTRSCFKPIFISLKMILISHFCWFAEKLLTNLQTTFSRASWSWLKQMFSA